MQCPSVQADALWGRSFKWKTHHKISTSLLMLKEWAYTASSRDALGNTSPSALEISFCPRAISRASGCKIPALGKSLGPRGIIWTSICCKGRVHKKRKKLIKNSFWYVCVAKIFEKLVFLFLFSQHTLNRQVSFTVQLLDHEICLKFWILFKVLKCGQNSEICLKSWNLLEILKFGQNPEI